MGSGIYLIFGKGEAQNCAGFPLFAKEMAKKNKDDFRGKCLKDDEGNLVTGEENLKKQWKYMEILLNEEK